MKPLDVNIEQYNDVVELYHAESDRAAAVMAGSFLEHHLGVFLKAFLVDDEKLIEKLFGDFGPLATFSQRILMAAALRLIDDGIRAELHAVKQIRNHFAHHPIEAKFTDHVLDGHFTKLRASTYPGFNPKGNGPLKDRRLIYLFSVSALVTSFHVVMLNKEAAEKAKNNQEK